MPKVRIFEDVSAADEPATAIYIRVTAEESVKTDLSIPNQRARALELCAERGWTTVKLYVEPRHVGGDKLPAKRPALSALLADIEAGRLARVFVRHTDRLWRGSKVQDQILDALRRNAVELWDFGGLREHRSAGGRFALKVLGAAAELEKGLTGERIREMKRGKAKSGKTGGGPAPYGYTSQGRVKREALADGLGPDEAERLAVERCPLSRALYVDAREAEVVRLIFELYLGRRFGTRRIADELNRLGHLRRSGLPWVPTRVGVVINNPVVAGFTSFDEEAYEKGVPSTRPRYRQTLYAGTHEAIIPKERWEEAQRIKDGNAKGLRRKAADEARTYALSGVLRCAACGSPMRGKSGGGGRSGNYICRRRAYYGPANGCSGPTIPQEWAERTTFAYLDRLFRERAVREEICERALRRATEALPKERAQLEKLRLRIADAGARQRKWMERYERTEDAASSEILWSRIRELKREESGLKEEAAALEARLAAAAKNGPSREDILRALASLPEFSKAEPSKRRALVERLCRRHDLRVRLVDARRIAVSLRLDPAEEPREGIGRRLVLVGPQGRKDPSAFKGPVSTGEGKTLLSRCIPSILPEMSHDEILETTKIHSAAGLTGDGLIEQRPYRSPHHTVSTAALIGGGSVPRPGEISLAHNGVLFLDELPEFSRIAIEALRQPLEDRVVTIGRVNGVIRFPASFFLAASANPCPCGWLDSGMRECTCSLATIERYRGRMSGPLLDRIDLRIFVRPLPLADLRNATPSESSASVRARVTAARARQVARLAPYGLRSNGEMHHAVLRATCKLSPPAEAALEALSKANRSLTGRAFDRIIKVARTIADLADQADIDADAILEAAAYRA